ncbi:hypothetical protein M0805_000309 [Coniferiporia weirii]|nr:hypothetical protein M0805_000309 [Coniferiporia weirii]
MRLKHTWVVFPLPAKAKLFWERVTFSRITTFYFIFSLLHCLIQVVFQIQAFTINAQAANFLWQLVLQGNAADPGFAVMSPNDLRFCETAPTDLSSATCRVIWSASAKNDTVQTDNDLLSPSSESLPASLNATPAYHLATTQTSASAQDVVTVTITKSVFPIASPTYSSNVSSLRPSSDSMSNDAGEGELGEVVSGDENGRSNGHRKRFMKKDKVDFDITLVDANGTIEVQVDGFGFNHKNVTLSQTCLFTLNWPVEKLDNTKREDITFIAFQFWVLAMSIVAILNESMPHIIASLLTHILATAWGGFQISQTNDFRVQFNHLTTDGACGINLLSTYWQNRALAEIPSLALNALALLLSAFLSWRLVKLFGWQTFKRVGASRTINRVYKLVLTLSIAIQLSLFFIVASIGLWIDSLYNGAVGHLSSQPELYKGVMIAVLLLLVPWLSMGWISVRRELRIPMLIFLVMSFSYLGGWGAMFTSTTFRWTFVLWRFFSLITSASVFLTLLTAIIGLVCRMNFGKGLPHYLNAEEPLPDDFVPVVSGKEVYDEEEKVEFPSGRAALPTFSAAFGRSVPPSQMRFGPPRLGPRFTNPSLEPFELQRDDKASRAPDVPVQPTAYLGDTHSRVTMPPANTNTDGATLFSSSSRPTSVGSQKSYSSFGSSSSAETHGRDSSPSAYLAGRRNEAFSGRWMIE